MFFFRYKDTIEYSDNDDVLTIWNFNLTYYWRMRIYSLLARTFKDNRFPIQTFHRHFFAISCASRVSSLPDQNSFWILRWKKQYHASNCIRCITLVLVVYRISGIFRVGLIFAEFATSLKSPKIDTAKNKPYYTFPLPVLEIAKKRTQWTLNTLS